MIHELTIEVAQHPVSLELEGDVPLDSIREVYHQFLCDKRAEFRLRIYPDHDLTVQDNSSVGLTLSDEKLTVVDDYLMGSVDLGKKQGEARINPIWFVPSLATFVRNLFTIVLVLMDSGLVLHALGVLRHGGVCVFFGPSGSGKSTVAELSPECIVLSDDIVFIKPVGRSYAVFPTPPWGDMQRGDRENRGYPLTWMFKLVKDREIRVKPLGLAHGISEVFTVPHIPPDALPFGDLLRRYQGLLAQVPCSEMHFTRDGWFWNAIEAQCSGLGTKEGEHAWKRGKSTKSQRLSTARGSKQ